jgi:hypothetical protein
MQGNRQWPPLVYASHKAAWIRWRDVALTMGMWLIFAAMLNKEFELFFGSYLQPLGLDPLFARLGIFDLGMKLNLMEFVVNLSPYFAVIVVLVAALSTFSVHTLMKRHRSLRSVGPSPLSLASQARDAALESRVADAGPEATHLNIGLGDAAPVDGPTLLALIHSQEEAALVDVRSLRIAIVRVTADGKYQIERAPEAGPSPAPLPGSGHETEAEVLTASTSEGWKAVTRE